MAKKETVNKVKALCKYYEVTCHFASLTQLGGVAYPYDSVIVLDTDLTDNMLLTAAFHEIQHCLNYRNKKYFNYHKKRRNKKLAKKIALRAEVYTDKEAKKLAKKHGFTNYKITYKMNKYWKKVINDFMDSL